MQTETTYSEKPPNNTSHNKNIMVGLNLVKPL